MQSTDLGLSVSRMPSSQEKKLSKQLELSTSENDKLAQELQELESSLQSLPAADGDIENNCMTLCTTTFARDDDNWWLFTNLATSHWFCIAQFHSKGKTSTLASSLRIWRCVSCSSSSTNWTTDFPPVLQESHKEKTLIKQKSSLGRTCYRLWSPNFSTSTAVIANMKMPM